MEIGCVLMEGQSFNVVHPIRPKNVRDPSNPKIELPLKTLPIHKRYYFAVVQCTLKDYAQRMAPETAALPRRELRADDWLP